MTNSDVAYGETTLPIGIRSRFVQNVNGITMHILEAGFEEPGRPEAVSDLLIQFLQDQG